MIEAQIFINVASPEEGGIADGAPYVIDGRRLRGASYLLADLQELGWTTTFAPNGFLEEGYVEWIATKRFADLRAARAEVGTLDSVRQVSADVAEPSAVLFDPLNESRPPGPMYLRYTLGEPAGERWRLRRGTAGRYIDIPIPAAPRRSIRFILPEHQRDGEGQWSPDAITVCEADGREVDWWAIEKVGADPGHALGAILAAALGIGLDPQQTR
ncbi:hypothetical protein Q5424_01095 [Conexibacter sp. JD483]|uniref:hypothetical protein n=1 Tax=unclassified Conexibacter TaxID=2627773 RepID=UPI0027244942|nr:MULTISPECIES: hypothetical protein [unclassified Conexibacter]MDO8185824.1 hypothetical protein [Conexibacter sp. CPCC 205706]MDO8198568.1 hypothetical protein [Conexibacter sp. CPCC 205762]MDR9367654.1 hypothetical protein [Conexibacter sp. JD483]